MSLLLAFVSLTFHTPSVEPRVAERETEVVVTGRKLKQLRARTDPRSGKCTVKRSSGDRDFDAATCAAMECCWPAASAELKPAEDRQLSKQERERIVLSARTAANACVFPLRERLLEELAERRVEMSR
jgi:hypothetical protein